MQIHIFLVTGNEKTKKKLQAQLELLLGDTLGIEALAIDQEVPKFSFEKFQVILFSSQSVRTEFIQRYSPLPKNAHLLTGKRTIDPEAFPRLLSLPKGKVLVVNDAEESIRETAESIYQLGINHLQFVSFHPGTLFYDGINTAITPSEVDRCPSSISHIVDIGVRPFDMTTILKIVDYFQLSDTMASKISERYLIRLVKLHERLLSKEIHTQKIGEHYHELLNLVDDGILAFDKEGTITAANHGMAKIFMQPPQKFIKQSIHDNITNSELLEFLLSNETRGFLTIGEQEHVLFKSTTSSFESTVITVKSVEKAFEIEQTAKRQYKGKGLASKYTLTDIIGEHPEMIRTKETALKMAAAEHPVLIYGDTGVGKELFAHAIHHNSKRWKGPFFAINCSAMSENLFHSELFGYEEGTFTGALKGGKKGLFELASGGTLFLDEIGELGTDIQAQLLRVLQENEIRKIGGNSNIPVDVRILAATNKHLEKEVENGQFRPDLFFRLHVLHITIPPLADRISDLPLLAEHFLQTEEGVYELHKEVMGKLLNYHWPGNIRELKSVLDYAKTLSTSHVLTVDNLPSFINQRVAKSNNTKLTPELLILLELLEIASGKGERLSLQELSEQSVSKGFSLSKQQVRHRIQQLSNIGLVEKGRGRIGSSITSKGIEQIK